MFGVWCLEFGVEFGVEGSVFGVEEFQMHGRFEFQGFRFGVQSVESALGLGFRV